MPVDYSLGKPVRNNVTGLNGDEAQGAGLIVRGAPREPESRLESARCEVLTLPALDWPE
jgi:hypothetical protein